MKKTIFRKLIFGATILSLLNFGARTLENSSAQTQPPPPDANVSPAADSSAPTAISAELPADIPPNTPLAQVIRLAQSGVAESVILSYVNNSGAAFNLTSDQIIYLKDLGLPDDAVTAMIQRDQQLGATTNVTPAPAPGTTVQTETPVQPVEVTQNYFYDTLSPYGGWVEVEGYGLCWRPTVVIYDSSWQPYCDHGHWVYTDAGWYWTSDYSWGGTAFHYGRWFHHPRFGWCWYPDTVWAPSWVTWRYGNDYCGWAPLPPRCVYREGVGIVFNGAVVRGDFDFGISVNFFTFVPTRHFCDPHPRRFRVRDADRPQIFNHTTVINNFNVNSRNHTVVNNGIPPQRISAISKTPIHQVAIRENTAPRAPGEHFDRKGGALVVNRPHFSENAATSLNSGVRPPAVRQNNTPRPLIIKGNGNNPRPATPGQNNFSRPAANQNPQPGRGVVAPQTPKLEPSETPRAMTPATQQRKPFSTPIPPPAAPAAGVSPPAPPPKNNYDYEKRVISPRRQQFEEQSPRVNPGNSVQRETPAAPAGHPQAAAPRNESPSSTRAAAPPEHAPAQSAPPAPQKSGGGKDQNGPGH